MKYLLAVLGTLGVGLASCWGIESDAKIAKLIEALDDPQHAVRLSAMKKLGTHGAAAKDAVPTLATLLRGPYKDLGDQAAQTMAKIGAPSVPLLIGALEEPVPICERALSALSAMGSQAQPAVGALAKLFNSPEKTIRLRAIRIVGNLGLASRPAIPGLGELMRNDKEKEVADRAARALAQIGVGAVPELMIGLRDRSLAVRERALAGLALIGPQAWQALPLVRECLAEERADVRALAIYVLGEMGGEAKDAVRDLRVAFRDGKTQVRQQALHAMREIGPAAAPELAEMLNDPDLEVRLDALQGLGLLDESAVPFLVPALQSDHARVRAAAASALGQIGPAAQKATPALLEAIKDQTQAVQVQAFNAVLQINSKHSQAVLEALGKINDEGRWAGAYVLKQFGPKPKDAVKPLTRMLQDADPMQRLGAVLALRELGPLAREAMPAMQPLLKDPNRQIRLAASVAVPAIADKKQDVALAQNEVIALLQEMKVQGDKMDAMQMVQLHVVAMSMTELRGQRTHIRQTFDVWENQLLPLGNPNPLGGFQARLGWRARDPLAELKRAMGTRLLNEVALNGYSIPAIVQGINLSARFNLGHC